MSDPQLLISQLKRGTPSILIVDDDPHIITGLRDILEDSGYIVEVAALAEEARDLLRRHTFSTMITDYSLPDDNGVDLAHQAKKQYPLLELILMSGHHPDHIREKMDTKAIKFLRKPVSVSVLLNALEQTIQRQCETLRIERGRIAITAPMTAEFIVTTTSTAQAASQKPIEIDRAKFETRNWWQPLAWCSVALVSFGIGWMSHARIPMPSISLDWSLPKTPVPEGLAAAVPRTEPVPAVAAKESPPLEKVVAAHRVIKRSSSLLSQLSDQDPAIQISAAKALLKKNLDQPQAVAVLLERMTDPFPKQRLASIEALSTSGVSTPEAISSLARALSDVDPSVAYAAASSLGHLSKAALPAINELVQAMNYDGGSVPSIVQAAKQAIIGIGDPALPALTAALDDPKIKPQALEMLARIKPPADTTVAAAAAENKVNATDPSTGLEDLPDPEQTQAAAAPAPLNPPSTH